MPKRDRNKKHLNAHSKLELLKGSVKHCQMKLRECGKEYHEIIVCLFVFDRN